MPLVRMASVSVPSTVMTAGCFSIVPTHRIAACGWLMIGVPMTEPNTPGLVIVNVPRCTSSGLSFLVRARSPRSLIARARPSSDSSSACLMTGTMSPQSSATAMPRLMSRRNTVLSPLTAALSVGCFRSAVRHRLGDERQIRQVHAAVGVLLLLPRAKLGDPGVVDLEDRVDVRRDPARHHHVLGRELPDPRPGLDPVARPGLDAGARGPGRRAGAAGAAAGRARG